QKERTIMLSKAKTLKGYRLDSRDGEIGKVKEFYFDDRHWAIRYLVADTGNRLAGRQVPISPYALGAVIEEELQIAVDLTKRQIEGSATCRSPVFPPIAGFRPRRTGRSASFQIVRD